jgi:hypothetical protein
MTVDLFSPPEPTLDAPTFLARRTHLLDEIGRSERAGWPGYALLGARRRPALLVAALVAVALIPVAALAVANDWWFLGPGLSPTPASEVIVVKTGTWDGKGWQLTAYRSDTEGLCYALTPTGSSGEGASISCDSIEGVPRTPESKPYTPHAISFVIGGGGVLPASIYGPVTDKAEEVDVYFRKGAVLRTPTVAPPSSLGAAVRFYAAPLPASVPRLRPSSRPGEGPLKKLVGLDHNGHVVACLTVPLPKGGVPLSACR